MDQPGFERLLALLFPPRCLGCGRRGTLLCEACQPTVPYLPATLCPVCSVPTRGGERCRRCAGAPRAFDSARAVCHFAGPVRSAVHQLKYRRARFVARWLAGLLLESLAVRPLRGDLLVPVPLAADRLRERGFNQAELIAAPLAERTGAVLAPTLLVRTRATPPQVGLSGADRQRNLRGAFRCPEPAAVAGRRVILVDDVMTTGATIEECARALRTAGAARVYGLVVARDV